MTNRRSCGALSELSSSMPQILEDSPSFTLSLNHCTIPSQGVVLKRRRFRHALLSVMSTKRTCSNVERENPKTNKLLLNSVGPVVEPKGLEVQTSCVNAQHLLRVPRKYRMRDQYGYILPRKGKAETSASDVSNMDGYSKLTMNVRSLTLGTLHMSLRGPVKFSVDYIEITNKVQIEAIELTSCEWCRGHGLPALFLQMTDTAYCHLRKQLAMSTDTEEQDEYQSKNQQEIYLLIILESEPTVLEEVTLESIFTEIGRLKNLSNFLVKLTCEEAADRLMGHKHILKELYPVPFSPTKVQSEVTTVSVSDSEDDLMECQSTCTQLPETLVTYPPPPAKGGFSITTEDLGCLDEGEYLNDVIMDFYLKYLVCETLEEEDANRCHVFSSFFYKSLTQNDLMEDSGSTRISIQERRHNRVKTWTRHVDLFKKDFIFVPINQSAHWYLAIICFPGQVSHRSIVDLSENKNEENSIVFTPSSPFSNPMSLFYRHQTSKRVSRWSAFEGELDKGFCFVSDDDLDDDFQCIGTSRCAIKKSDTTSKLPCILIMDSLSCGAKPTVVKILQEYLEMEWRVKKGSPWSFGKRDMNGWSVQVPQQDNHTDCGLYVLQYVESFVTNPPRTFHSDMDLTDWFPQKLVKRKRDRIKQLIFRLHRQQQGELGE